MIFIEYLAFVNLLSFLNSYFLTSTLVKSVVIVRASASQSEDLDSIPSWVKTTRL